MMLLRKTTQNVWIAKAVIGIMLSCLLGLSAFPTSIYAEEGTGNELIDSFLEDEDFLASDNFMVQELTQEILNEDDNTIQPEEGQTAIDNPYLPQWMTGTKDGEVGHADIIEHIMGEFSDVSQKKRELIGQCLLYGSYKADTTDMHDRSKNIIQLHAMRNYVANLKALWKYSKLIYENTDTYCYNNIINTMPKLTDKEQQDLSILLKTVPKIYNHYKTKVGHAPSKLEKKYLVMGLALHLIGDIYAHRTFVPAYYGDTSSSNPYWHQSYFKDYKKLLEAVRTGTLLCTKIDNYMKPNLPKKLNSYYEDNVEFIPNRYTFSKRTCKKFIHEIRISGNNFSSSYILRKKSDDIVLDNFNDYATRAGA